MEKKIMKDKASEDTKQKLSKLTKNRIWINNG